MFIGSSGYASAPSVCRWVKLPINRVVRTELAQALALFGLLI
jgi:hypothetical protein